jgi:hypothetical protein
VEEKMGKLKSAALGCALVLATASGSLADDVTDQIDEALKAYQKKDYATATAALDAAANLIRQSKAETTKSFLPAPLSGWTASDAEATAMGAAMMGGGTTVSRQYHKGDDQVEITLLSDSPMLQAMAMMFTGAMSGPDNKLVVIDGRKTSYSKSENAYQTLVANKTLVKVAGSEGVDDKTLRAYLKAVKFADLEKAAQ